MNDLCVLISVFNVGRIGVAVIATQSSFVSCLSADFILKQARRRYANILNASVRWSTASSCEIHTQEGIVSEFETNEQNLQSILPDLPM